MGGDKFSFATGTATSRVEAPRGEVMYSVSWKENSRNPARVHVRTPTYANMPAVRWMVRGARLADRHHPGVNRSVLLVHRSLTLVRTTWTRL